ncbi:MAG TPA: flagellar basal-body MS-ring/collar protein FliF [Novosphingobium sp.]
MFEKFRNFPPRNQIAMIVLALALCSLILLAVWYAVLRVQYQAIFTRIRAADAAVLVAELDKRKIPYRLSDAGTTISVPQDQADAVRLGLVGSDAALKGEVGFELFDKSDMGITDFAQKINFQRALQGELERTIITLDGVESARVHLSMGDDRLFRQDRAPPKASVTLRMRDGASVQASTVAGVQQLVSAAVPLLDAGAVVVLDETGRVMGANETIGIAAAPQMTQKQAIEQYLQARIREALDPVFGPDYITVTVSVPEPPVTPDQAFDLKNRNFRVAIRLRPRRELSEKVHENLRAAVEQSIGFDTALGDTVTFEAPQIFLPAVPVANPAPRPAPMPAVESGLEQEGGAAYLAAGISAIAILCIALLFRLLRRSPVPLDEEARIHFADRLQSLLDEDAADGTAKA